MKPILISFFCLQALFVIAQKPPIDPTIIKNWPSIEGGSSVKISKGGDFVLYSVSNIPAGKNTLVLQSTHGTWKQEFIDGSEGVIASDGKTAVFRMPGDSICLYTLGTDKRIMMSHVVAFALIGKGIKEKLVYQVSVPMSGLVVKSINDEREWTFSGVLTYTSDDDGTHLLLNISSETGDNGNPSVLKLVDLSSADIKKIWQGDEVSGCVFDRRGDQVAFIGGDKEHPKGLFYFNSSMKTAECIVDSLTPGVDSNLAIHDDLPAFSNDGKKIFFQLIEKPLPGPVPGAALVDVWNYKDPALQSWQLMSDVPPQKYWSVVSIEKKQVFRLQGDRERVVFNHAGKDDLVLTLYLGAGGLFEEIWNRFDRSELSIVSTEDGSRKVIKANSRSLSLCSFSPDGNWVLFFDDSLNAWMSYNTGTGKIVNAMNGMTFPVSDANEREFPPNAAAQSSSEIGMWVENSTSVFIYDKYDVWKLDPTGKKSPVNLTGGYGRKHQVKFRIARDIYENPLLLSPSTLLLSAFNCISKYNGFYEISLNGGRAPTELFMGPYDIYTYRSQHSSSMNIGNYLLLKADSAKVWVVERMSPAEAPNLFVTADFKKYAPLSHLAPQSKYNWVSSSFIQWNNADGSVSSGILYKPENFDFSKKYPLIFHFYERRSDELYYFCRPRLCDGNINDAYFVSNGYLVFAPDIHYKTGETGESALNTVLSAANYLRKFTWVDGDKMGISGHSFGGFEASYLVTHTNIFAAAAEAAGPTDMISCYSGLKYNTGGALGVSQQSDLEVGQLRIGATLWERPDLYIKNSPIFYADKVTTPLLMMHNRKDGTVQFGQAVEFFTALRRLGRRVWLLQYDRNGHALGTTEDEMDYTIRIKQFFDHYLKGAPLPIWMSKGIPARQKGIQSGYEYDVKTVWENGNNYLK